MFFTSIRLKQQIASVVALVFGIISIGSSARANYFQECSINKGAERCMEIFLSNYPCYLEQSDLNFNDLGTFGGYKDILFEVISSSLTNIGVSRAYAQRVASNGRTIKQTRNIIVKNCPSAINKLRDIEDVFLTLGSEEWGDQEQLTFEVFSNLELLKDYVIRTSPKAVKKLGVPTNFDIEMYRLATCEAFAENNFQGKERAYEEFCRGLLSKTQFSR